MKMSKLVINPPPGCLKAWERAASAAALPVDKWAIKACNTAAGHRPSNTGFLGVSDSAPKRMAFRVNWSEGGVKKSTTMAYTPATREERLKEAFEFLEARERGEPRLPTRRGRKPLENDQTVPTAGAVGDSE